MSAIAPFSTSIILKSPHPVSMGDYMVMSPTTFTLVEQDKSVKGSVYVRLIGDDMHTPEFVGFKQHPRSFPYDKAMNAVNLVKFTFDGYEAYYQIFAPNKELVDSSSIVVGSTLSGTTVSVDTTEKFSVDETVTLGYLGPSASFSDMTVAGYITNNFLPSYTYVDQLYNMILWKGGKLGSLLARYERNTPEIGDDSYIWMMFELNVPYDFSGGVTFLDSAYGSSYDSPRIYQTNLDIDPQERYVMISREVAQLGALALDPVTKRHQYSSHSIGEITSTGTGITGTYWFDNGWKMLRSTDTTIYVIDNTGVMSEPYKFSDTDTATYPVANQNPTTQSIPTFMPNMVNVQFNGNGKKLQWATTGVGGGIWEIELAQSYTLNSYVGSPVRVDNQPWPANFHVAGFDYDNNSHSWAVVGGWIEDGSEEQEGRVYMFEMESGTFAGLSAV